MTRIYVVGLIKQILILYMNKTNMFVNDIFDLFTCFVGHILTLD